MNVGAVSGKPESLVREAIIPIPASRRLSAALAVAVSLVACTAILDVMLWGLLNRPLVERREAAAYYQVRQLEAERAQLAMDVEQLRQRADTLSAALLTCESSSDWRLSQSGSVCAEGEIEVVMHRGGTTFCVPRSSRAELRLSEVSLE